MKNYVLLAFMVAGLLVTNDSNAGPNAEIPTNSSPKLELKVEPETEDTSRYLPIWILGDDTKDKVQKFIWVPSKDGQILVLEASNSAILRLAWNLDTYVHEAKTKTN